VRVWVQLDERCYQFLQRFDDRSFGIRNDNNVSASWWVTCESLRSSSPLGGLVAVSIVSSYSGSVTKRFEDTIVINEPREFVVEMGSKERHVKGYTKELAIRSPNNFRIARYPPAAA